MRQGSPFKVTGMDYCENLKVRPVFWCACLQMYVYIECTYGVCMYNILYTHPPIHTPTTTTLTKPQPPPKQTYDAHVNWAKFLPLLLSLAWGAHVLKALSGFTTAAIVGNWWHHNQRQGQALGAALSAYLKGLTTSFGSLCLSALVLVVLRVVRLLVFVPMPPQRRRWATRPDSGCVWEDRCRVYVHVLIDVCVFLSYHPPSPTSDAPNQPINQPIDRLPSVINKYKHKNNSACVLSYVPSITD